MYKMSKKQRLTRKKLFFGGLAALLVTSAVGTAVALKDQPAPKIEPQQENTEVVAQETEIAPQEEVINTPSAQPQQPTTPEPVPEPQPTAQEYARANYLHPTLKAKISASNEEKTWLCFNEAITLLSEKDTSFPGWQSFNATKKVTQTSAKLINPCGQGIDTFVLNGKVLASYALTDYCQHDATTGYLATPLSCNWQ